MSSGTTYVVTLSLQTQGNLGAQVGALGARASQAHGHVMSLRHAFNQVGEVAERVGSRVGNALEGVADAAGGVAVSLAKVGAAAVLGAATYGVAKLNNNLEQTQISLGAIAQAQGFTKTFEGGFSAAGDQLAKMKQDVKTLPGDLGQLSDIMKMIATPAAQAGAGLDDIRKLSGRTMLTSTILGVPQEVASREMANLLAGRAGAHNILGSRLGLIGDDAKKFNAAAPEVRLAKINSELDRYQGAADRFSHSFVAQWTTLKDNIKYSMLAPATTGLFERVTHGIAEANDYLDRHKEKIEEIASLINRRLVAAWDAVEKALKKYGPIFGKYADQIAHMQPAEMGAHLEHAGKVYAGMKLGGMALSGGSSMLGSGMRALGSLGGVGGLGGAVSGAGLATTLGGLGGGIALLGTGAVATIGAVHDLTDSTSIYHDSVVSMTEAIGKNGTDAFNRLSLAASQLHLEAISDKMGKDMVFGIESAVKGLDLFISTIQNVESASQKAYDKAKDKLFGPTPTLQTDSPGAIAQHIDEPLSHLVQLTKDRIGPEQDTASKRGAGGGGGHGPVTINIRVDGAGDPSRVARLIVDEADRRIRNPKKSPHLLEHTSPK